MNRVNVERQGAVVESSWKSGARGGRALFLSGLMAAGVAGCSSSPRSAPSSSEAVTSEDTYDECTAQGGSCVSLGVPADVCPGGTIVENLLCPGAPAGAFGGTPNCCLPTAPKPAGVFYSESTGSLMITAPANDSTVDVNADTLDTQGLSGDLGNVIITLPSQASSGYIWTVSSAGGLGAPYYTHDTSSCAAGETGCSGTESFAFAWNDSVPSAAYAINLVDVRFGTEAGATFSVTLLVR